MSASVVGKRVLHVKHGRSASSRASPPERVLERSNSVASDCEWTSGCREGHALGAAPRGHSRSLFQMSIVVGSLQPLLDMKPPETAEMA